MNDLTSAAVHLNLVGARIHPPGAGLSRRRRDGGLPLLQRRRPGTDRPRAVVAEGLQAVQGPLLVHRRQRPGLFPLAGQLGCYGVDIRDTLLAPLFRGHTNLPSLSVGHITLARSVTATIV
jgi:hypothetical protein